MELLVVIFIISLLLATSFPSFTGIESNSLRSEAKRLASLLRYLNDTATARKEEYYMLVNLGDNSITYLTEEGEKRERIDHLRSIYLETKGEIESGEVKVIFTPLGAGEFIRFHLLRHREAGRDLSYKVELNPLSGRVRVKDE
jgi:Tfp pilus assembly protein FimT